MAAANDLEGGSHTAAPAHFWKLALGSVGVVYGDIGTSPLYALREALHQASRDGILGESEVIGIVSLLLWTLILIVTLKYVVLMLRADNRGEGGTLSLLALAQRAVGRRTPLLLGLWDRRRRALLRRRGDHPGDLGPLGGRGPRAGHPGPGALRPADHLGDPVCSVLGAEPRHRAGLGILRSDNAGVVHDPGGAGVASRLRPAADLSGDRPVNGRQVLHRAWLRVVCGNGLGVPGGDRGRGALRRHGPFRPRPNPSGVVRGGVSRRWRSTTSGRAASCWLTRRRPRTRSSFSLRSGGCFRWS